MRERGFTLVEILVVIAITSFLSSIVYAAVTTAREKSRVGAARYFAAQIDHVTGDQAAGWWEFDDCNIPPGNTTALDRSGGANNGVLTNGPVWSTNTPNGTGCSISFDGIDDYVNVGNATSLNPSTTITVSFWFNAAVYKNAIPLGRDNGARNDSVYGFKWRASGVPWWRIIDSGSVSHDLPLATIPTLGVWHHVAMTYDGTTMRSYLDGALNGTPLTFSATMLPSTSPTEIGRGITGEYFNGLIDSPRVINKVLTAQEIGKMYAKEKDRYDVFARK